MLSVENCTATLQHLVAAALAPGRGVSANELIADLSTDDDLKNGAAVLDSLDQLTVARHVAEFFELEKAGTEEFLLRRSRLDQWSDVIIEAFDDGTLTDIWFRSGGTTVEPKLIPQPITHLLSEAREISSLVQGTHRIISLVPLHHIYGFIWGPLLSEQLGVPVIHGPKAVATAHNNLQRCDLLIGVPEWWQYVGGSRKRLPEGVRGVTSTAPCPPRVIQAVLDRGLESMMEVYGSSDTAGIAWRDEMSGEFQLFKHWKRHDDDHLESAAGTLYPLPDWVQWHTERSLTPGTRRDFAIQVGGVNVWPDRIRAFMENHPQVQACAVRPLDTGHGTRLKAFIVPVDPARDDLLSELRSWITTSLPAAERPIHLTLGAALPRDGMGKLCDW